MPRGKSLFFPIANAVSFCPDSEETVDDLRENAAAAMDAITSLSLTIDGDLFDLRVQSPVFKTPKNGLLADFGIPQCEGTQAVSDGFWVLLSRLSEGEYVIRFDVEADGFEVHVEYYLTIIDDVD